MQRLYCLYLLPAAAPCPLPLRRCGATSLPVTHPQNNSPLATLLNSFYFYVSETEWKASKEQFLNVYQKKEIEWTWKNITG